MNMTWQVVEVKRPLALLGRLCEAGNAAIFTKEGGFIIPTSSIQSMLTEVEKKQALKIKRDVAGVYSFDMWAPSVQQPQEQQVLVKAKPAQLSNRFAVLAEEGFQRHGRMS